MALKQLKSIEKLATIPKLPIYDENVNLFKDFWLQKVIKRLQNNDGTEAVELTRLMKMMSNISILPKYELKMKKTGPELMNPWF